MEIQTKSVIKLTDESLFIIGIPFEHLAQR